MSEPLDYRGYPCKPRKINENIWYYEQPSGLDIHVDAEYHVSFTIPWRRVEAALKHRLRALKDKP